MAQRAAALPVRGAFAQDLAERPPNFVVILFDKCRRDAIGAYGR